MSDIADLIVRARDGAVDRKEVFASLVQLYRERHGSMTPAQREELASILRGLQRNVPESLCAELVGKLGLDGEVPRELLVILGGDHHASDSVRKLIEKLASSGQLKPSYLMRVLKQGQIELFDLGLARLIGVSPSELNERFYGGGPRGVALACRAAGIDRAVFQTIYALSRKAHDMPPQAADLGEIEAAFATPKPVALDYLRAA